MSKNKEEETVRIEPSDVKSIETPDKPEDIIVEAQSDTIAVTVKPKTWNGYAVLECPELNCKYDTIYEHELNEHVVKAHSLPPVAPRLITLVDRFGNEQKG